jgi:transposase-like protein
MRIQVRLPKIEPNVYEKPEKCPYGCGGTHYRAHGVQGENKALLDVGYKEVQAYRYECVRCGGTFRVYPRGVSKGAQQSKRFKGMTVLLYVLGLSYGAVEDFTGALGCGACKTTVYNNVQEAGVVARKKQREGVKSKGKRAVIGADGTYVKVKGETVGIEVVVDDSSGELLGLDIITSEKSEEILEIIQEVVKEVEAEVLVSDDHGAYQEVVTKTGVEHQICRSHVKRNVDDSVASLTEHLQHAEPLPAGLTLTAEQVRADLAQLQRLVRERPPDGEAQLAALYERYKDVPTPPPGTRHSVWYRTYTCVTRLWNRWYCLTLDQRRDDLDGTNNSCERLIGWWIKERYRPMRGYKREESIKNVVTLTALMGAYPGYFDMAHLIA